MATFLLLLSAAALLLLVTATVRAVRRDGYGQLPPVRSHHGWDDAGSGASLSTMPDARDLPMNTSYLPPIR